MEEVRKVEDVVKVDRRILAFASDLRQYCLHDRNLSSKEDSLLRDQNEVIVGS